MRIKLNRINDNYLFEGVNENGQKILLNNVREDKENGVSPMETVLMAVAGCSSIDIIHILKKQRQEISHFSAEVEGDRVEEGDVKPFRSIKVKVMLEGDINEEKARKAAELSFEKYCSVAEMLKNSVEIGHEVYVNGKKVD